MAAQIFRNRPIHVTAAPQPIPTVEPESASVVEEPAKEEIRIEDFTVYDNEASAEATKSTPKASAIATGCIPCAIGHFGTGSGLINEAMRFAKDKGLESEEVIDRVGMCLDELNTMERVDLRSEMIADLSEWEKALANEVLSVSRTTRHKLEDLKSVDDLEQAASTMQSIRTRIWRGWVKGRMQNLTPEDQVSITRRVTERMAELAEET